MTHDELIEWMVFCNTVGASFNEFMTGVTTFSRSPQEFRERHGLAAYDLWNHVHENAA